MEKLKSIILEVLKEKMDTLSVYNGGGEEPTVVYIKESFDSSIDSELNQIADEIVEKFSK